MEYIFICLKIRNTLYRISYTEDFLLLIKNLIYEIIFSPNTLKVSQFFKIKFQRQIKQNDKLYSSKRLLISSKILKDVLECICKMCSISLVYIRKWFSTLLPIEKRLFLALFFECIHKHICVYTFKKDMKTCFCET